MVGFCVVIKDAWGGDVLGVLTGPASEKKCSAHRPVVFTAEDAHRKVTFCTKLYEYRCRKRGQISRDIYYDYEPAASHLTQWHLRRKIHKRQARYEQDWREAA